MIAITTKSSIKVNAESRAERMRVKMASCSGSGYGWTAPRKAKGLHSGTAGLRTF